MRVRLILALLALPMTGACVGTAVDIATAPIKAGGRAVGIGNHAESDRALGRRVRRERKLEAREAAAHCSRRPEDCRYFSEGS